MPLQPPAGHLLRTGIDLRKRQYGKIDPKTHHCRRKLPATVVAAAGSAVWWGDQISSLSSQSLAQHFSFK